MRSVIAALAPAFVLERLMTVETNAVEQPALAATSASVTRDGRTDFIVLLVDTAKLACLFSQRVGLPCSPYYALNIRINITRLIEMGKWIPTNMGRFPRIAITPCTWAQGKRDTASRVPEMIYS